MSGWRTRFDRISGEALADLSGLSPSLLFFKWLPFDGSAGNPGFDTKESRSPFLERVAELSNGLTAGEGYKKWRGRYLEALKALAAERLTTASATTVWRLVIGLGGNPAFETGLQLHHLHGFPYLPGSAVRGLVRHVAEQELMDAEERCQWLERTPEAGEEAAVARFLDDAAQVWALLGSLSVAQHRVEGEDLGWPTPRALLKRWTGESQGLPEELKNLRTKALRLQGDHTGGMITFYDAVPGPGQEGLLQLDLVNPHYPDYYRNPATTPPSDDQDPIPVTFLAVKPGAVFDFAFSVAPMPRGKPRDDEERERSEALGKLDSDAIRKKVEGWLKKGLETWGIGGKTAAGYGYMTLQGSIGKSIEDRLRSINQGNAATEVPLLLAELTGPAKREAATKLIEELHGRWLRKRQDQPWVLELFAAKDGPA